jgi:hypothetical protein
VRAEKGCIEYGATVDAQGMPAGKGSFGPDTNGTSLTKMPYQSK